MEKAKIDLTTVIGINNVVKYFNLSSLDIVVGLLKDIMSSKATKEQGKVVAEIIKQGRDQGVDEMEIKVKNTKGLDLSAPIDGAEVTVTAGSKEYTTIKVKYK